MIKNIGILVIGLLAGAFFMNVYTNQQKKEINTGLTSSEIDANQQEANSNLSFDDGDINSVNTKALHEEVGSLKAELEKVKTSTLNSQKQVVEKTSETSGADSKEMSEAQYSKAMMELFEKRNKPNAEEERLGSVALEELKRTQPAELKKLFDDNPESKNPLSKQIENNYKKHLSQDKDINWAYESEGFLKNYFGTLQSSNFTALRIDCRTKTCEVAGIFTFKENIAEGSDPQVYLTGRVQSFANVQQAIQKQALYKRYFEGGMSSMNFNTEALSLNPMPYSFFLNRVKDSQ